MKTFVLDANAVIRYMRRNEDWEKVKALLGKARNGEALLFICVVNWGEVVYTMAKYLGLSNAISDLKTLGAALTTVYVEEELAEEAASLKHNFKLGYADSFAAALAIRMNATLVTADPDFAKLGKQLKLMSLARHNE